MGVINYALKGGALWRSTCSTQNNNFPLSTGAHGQQTLRGQSRAIHTAFQDFGGIEVSMVGVAAAAATKGFRRAGASVDVAAGRARLRAVGSRHLDKLALPGELVAKHFHQPAPARIENSAGQARPCLDHVGNLKALHDHGCERQTPARRRLSRSPEQAVARALLVAVAKLLRGVLRRSSARDRQTLHPSTARRGFLPDLRDGVSAPEIR
jgi:hypothetical protein